MKIKNIYLFLLVLFTPVKQIISMEKKGLTKKPSLLKDLKFVSRAAIIILDDSECNRLDKEGGMMALMPQLNAAVENKDSIFKGPIIVSASLAIFSFFNGDNFVIKKTALSSNGQDHYVYIIYSKDYLESIGIRPYDVTEEAVKENDVTQVELTLGIKVNHMVDERTDLMNVIANTTKRLSRSDRSKYIPFPEDAKYFVDNFDKIFCSTKDYLLYNTKNIDKKMPYPRWSFFMFGHGEMTGSVVGLKIKDFRDLLEKFEKNINTAFLGYSTCYSGGENEKKIYEDIKNREKQKDYNLLKNYPFVIFSTAVTDAPITVGSRDQYDFKKLLNIMSPEPDDKSKVTFDIKNIPLIKYEDIFNSLKKLFRYVTIPQIKYPGMPWFIPYEKQASIGSALVNGWNKSKSKKSIDVKTYFKDPEVLLLYAQNIPVELILSEKLASVISMIPGDAYHIFDKISSKSKIIDDISKIFLQIRFLSTKKIFFIKDLNIKDRQYKDVLLYNMMNKSNYEFYRYVFYKDNNEKIYFKDLSYTPDSSDDDIDMKNIVETKFILASGAIKELYEKEIIEVKKLMK